MKNVLNKDFESINNNVGKTQTNFCFDIIMWKVEGAELKAQKLCPTFTC